MGYTHYFTQKRDYTAEEFAQVSEDIGIILSYVENEQGIAIRGGSGEGKPEFVPDAISFNGAGADAHENFYIERERTLEEWQTPDRLGWGFCKTARKSYDIAVVACLCYLATVAESHDVSSDGDGQDFVQGLELARQALPRYANMLDIPHDVMAADRWIGPWLSSYVDGYEINFCVDGKAYILGPKGKTYRFYSHHEAAQWALSHNEKPVKVENFRGELVTEGGGNLFKPSGFFNEKRNKSLARQQKPLFDAMLAKATGDRAAPPPAFVRPGEMPVMDTRKRVYSLQDLLEMADAA